MSINLERIAKFLGAKDFTSEDVVKKGIEKIAPRLKGFFNKASKYGFPAGAAIGFLQNEFSKGKPDQSLRPDQQANAELQNQAGLPGRVLGAVGKTALGAATGGLGGAVLGALGGGNQEQNQQQQQPRQQPQQEQQMGNEGRSPSPMSADINAQMQAAKFRGGQPSEMSQNINDQMRAANAQQTQFDPLAGFSDYPELTRFIQAEHAKGGTAQSIGSKARKSSKLSPMVSSIENKAGEEFESLLGRILGGYKKQQVQQQRQQQPQSSATLELKGLIQQYMQAKSRGGGG